MKSNTYLVAKKIHGLRNPVLRVMSRKNIDRKRLDNKKNGPILNAINNWTYSVSSPRPATVKKVAKFLKVDPVELMMNLQVWINEDWECDPKEYIYTVLDDLD